MFEVFASSFPDRSSASTSTLVERKRTNTDTLLWGATGEQEWSAAIATGVDWKSLTLPACLPMTTDFFPSEETMKNDYVESNYSLLPDLINDVTDSMVAMNLSKPVDMPVYGRSPMTTKQVFLELVSQRLSQGFQLILPKDVVRTSPTNRKQRRKKKSVTSIASSFDVNVSAGSSTTTSAVDLKSLSKVGGVRGTVAASPLSRTVVGGGRRSSDAKLTPERTNPITEEYMLSIGTLFHKLVLVDDSTIEAKVYRPRKQYKTLELNYSYRFRAPYMTSYEISSTKFKTEKLQDYKWNYLDNYISLYTDYFEKPLIEDLKYWRVRMVLVPDFHRSVTRSLMDNWRSNPDTGIYEPLSPQQQQAAIDGFLKFLEFLHRIKRPALRKSRGSLPTSVQRGHQQQMTGGQNFGEEMKRSLCLSSPLEDIVTAMRSQQNGLNFFSPPHPRLPHFCFLSADAVVWINDNVEGAQSHQAALGLLNTMLSKDLIRHASGTKRNPMSGAGNVVHYGFYIYFIVTGNREQDFTRSKDTYFQEFHEVEINPVRANVVENKTFLQPEVPPLEQPFRTSADRLLSKGPVCIDQSNRSERSEWGDIACSTSYSTDVAYLFSLRWMCATGALVGDLISNWHRRVQSCNLFLFPIPSDPFALPHSRDCDPLRGPLHLPLIMSCNPSCSSEGPPVGFCPHHYVFSDLPSNNRPQRIRHLQEAILKRFGFVRFLNELSSSGSGAGGNDPNQYIHVTGNAFVMVLTPGILEVLPSHQFEPTQVVQSAKCTTGFEPTQAVPTSSSIKVPSSGDNNMGTPPQRPTSLYAPPAGVELDDCALTPSVASPHEEYFHRLMADTVTIRSEREKAAQVQSPGFLWSFNYMLTKRWKSSASGDEALGERLLHDFRHFCANKDNRLRNFCESFTSQEMS